VWPRVRHCYGDHNFNKVTFHPEQFTRPASVKKPSTFFVGFYSDIRYWNREWIEDTLHICEMHPQHTFMFLTKTYTAYDGIAWPSNTMQGVTIQCDQSILPQEQIINTFLSIKDRRPFISIEPILGREWHDKA
jgi:protein gp37